MTENGENQEAVMMMNLRAQLMFIRCLKTDLKMITNLEIFILRLHQTLLEILTSLSLMFSMTKKKTCPRAGDNELLVTMRLGDQNAEAALLEKSIRSYLKEHADVERVQISCVMHFHRSSAARPDDVVDKGLAYLHEVAAQCGVTFE